MAPDLRFPRGLYGITPEWDDTPALLQAISQAAQGGMVALQWRRKNLTPSARFDQAQKVVQLCKTLGVVSIINDDWELAANTHADGVHLGRDDGNLTQARHALGPKAVIGCSCYNELDRAEQALRDGADYIAFGALYPSNVKPNAPRATLEHIRQGLELTQKYTHNGKRAAVVTIGGIGPENAAPLIQAGADSIAVITALFEANDVRESARQCTTLFA